MNRHMNRRRQFVVAAEAGGTIAYGADYAENCRSSAYFVDRIFKGAKALGLTIPYSVPLRADRVIE